MFLKKLKNPPKMNQNKFKDSINNSLINIDKIPTSSGCYIFYDEKSKVIYVGKANNLRSRIRSYLQNTDTRYHVRFLISKTQKIDYMVTDTEREALLLENTLIKQYKPRYNIRLKDDKNYLSLRIDPSEDFPRLTFTRKPKKDTAVYFGPFHSASTIRDVYKHLHYIVPLRRCTDNNFRNRTRPCLYYELGTCLAPCVHRISKEQYSELVQQAILLLQGKMDILEQEFLQQIKKFSEELQFEQAGIVRDRLFALRKIMEPQKTLIFNQSHNVDVWGIYISDNHLVIYILFYKEGKLIGSRTFNLNIPIEIPLSEFFGSLILETYTQKLPIPQEILLPVKIKEIKTLSELFFSKTGKKVLILCPQHGEKEELVKLACKNAESKFLEEKELQTNKGAILQEIQRMLHLSKIPKRIECFDASTYQGDNTVVGMVVFENGIAFKSHYRKFSIKKENIHDDYYSLREALTRRFRDLTDIPLPDLLLIDGGKGQLGVAVSVLNDLNIKDISCVGMAKARNKPSNKNFFSTQDRFFIPNRSNPIIIQSKNSPALLLLQQIRDEAHRFAIQYQRKKKLKTDLTSNIKIPGIGTNKFNQLLSKFKSVENLKNATIEQLMDVEGIGPYLAIKIYKYFHK